MKRFFAVLLVISVSTMVNAANAADEKPKINFSGVLWASYWHAVTGGPDISKHGAADTSIAKGDSADYRNATHGTANSFDIKRVYLNAAGNFDEAWSWKVTYEFGGTPTLTPFAKASFLKWDVKAPFPYSFTFGLQPTLIWATSESYWGYRVAMNAPREMLGKTVVSTRYKLSTGSSADFGLTLNAKPIPMVSVSVQVANGAGFKVAEGDQYKKVSLTAAVYPIPKSVVELYYETEAVPVPAGVKATSRTGLGLFAGYKVDQFGFGVDYFQKNFDDKSASLNVVSSVTSVFGNYALNDKLRLLARFDTYAPLSDEAYLTGGEYGGKAGESLIIVGADCSYGPPNTHFILTYQNASYDAKIKNGANWEKRDSYGAVVLDMAISF